MLICSYQQRESGRSPVPGIRSNPGFPICRNRRPIWKAIGPEELPEFFSCPQLPFGQFQAAQLMLFDDIFSHETALDTQK